MNLNYAEIKAAIEQIKALRAELMAKVSEGERLTNERNNPVYATLSEQYSEDVAAAMGHLVKSNSLFIQCVTALASCDDQKANGELGSSLAQEFYENLRGQAMNTLEAHGLAVNDANEVLRVVGRLMNDESDVIADISAKSQELKAAVHALPTGSQLITHLLAGLDDDKMDIEVVEVQGNELLGLVGEIMQAMAEKRQNPADRRETHKAPETKQ